MAKRSRKPMRDRTVYLSKKVYDEFVRTGKAASAFLAPGDDLLEVRVANRRVKESQGQVRIERA